MQSRQAGRRQEEGTRYKRSPAGVFSDYFKNNKRKIDITEYSRFDLGRL